MLFNTKDSSTLIGAILQKFQQNKEVGEYGSVLKSFSTHKDDLLNIDFSDYRSLSDNVKDSLESIQREMNKTGKTGEDMFNAINNRMDETAKKGTELGHSIANFAKGLANFAVSTIASIAITALIDVAIKKLDKAIITAKEAAQMTERFKESYSSMQQEQAESIKTLGDLEEEFNQLSKGVNSLGTNVSLTEEEFERYHEITAIIADEIPTLVKGYDDQGNAIIKLTGNVNSLTEAYKSMQEQQAHAQYYATDEDGTRITAGVFKNTQNIIEDEEKRYRDLNETRETILKLIELDEQQFNQVMEEVAHGDANGNYNTELEDLVSRAGWTGGENDDYTEIRKNLMDMYKETETEFREYEANLKAATVDIAQAGQLYVKGISIYWSQLNDSQRSLLDSFLGQINSMEDIGIISQNYGLNITNEEEMKKFVTLLVGDLQSISDETLNQVNLRFNIDTLFNNNELSYDEYLAQLQDLESWLSTLPEEQQTLIRVLFDVADTDDQGHDIEQSVIDARKNVGTYGKNSYEKTDRDKQVDKWIGTLDKDELAIVSTLELNGDELLVDLKKALADAQNIADDNSIDVEVKASDAVDSMADAKTAITSLEELWNQTVKNSLSLGKDKKYLDENGNVIKQLNDKNQAIGFADPATINSVESAFYKFSDKLKKEGNDAAANKINLALEEFQKTLTEFPGDADKAQEAIDNLITAYIDQTDIIQNLTEENAEWSKAQLEAYGVTNAEEVVMSRLSTTTKQLTKQFKSATDALQGLTNAQADNYDEQSMQTVQDQLNSMFSTDALWNGETLTPDFDPTWIIQNLDMLKEAAAGSTDAMWELQKVAAQKIAAQIDINAPNPAAVNDIQNQINSLISHFDIEDVKVGTSINTSPIIQGLNQLVTAGTITRDSMNAILAGIGVEPQITYKDIPISVDMQGAKNQLRNLATTGENYYNSKYMLDAIENKTLTGNVRVPVIDYVATNKAVGAKYASPSGGSSSGGGGGGGGGGGSSSEPNKPKEEAEETFDWIEVAIQRIEEEIARLDKVVGNSYDAWIRRNEALLKEINKTKDEIKAQQLAQEEYLRNANKVQVNNGRGLNPDDYGENDQLVKAQDQKLLDEAKKAWATGQYQKKVREGLLTGDDIEKIQNHFLADTIKFYQELYNKAIAAGDAVEDLKIKLGDLARTNFDNVKSEYEEALAYFESYSSLIDERINRTEEKGYFVSKKYYQNLIAYDNKSLQKLKDEYNDLIKKRDEAVQSGAILSGSSEWNAMNQEILDVANSIEQATTKLVEFNNQMRQIDWDVFDYARDRINAVNDEFEFLIDLLDNQKLYDDWGIFNERGWADAALHAGKYNTLMQQSLDYAKEREKIEKELANDKANKDLIERREELIKLQQESIQNAYAEKEAVKSLVEEGINIHLQKLQETIDEYKKAIQDAKGLYDYQKNINNQVKNLTNLEKQLQAYSGDDSEEARATIQRLQKSLEDAQTQLKETQWDKYISETETFLSDMYDDYSETLNKRLDDIDLLMHDIVDGVNDHRSEITSITKEVVNEVAYGLTSSLSTFLNGSNNVLVSDFKTRFDTYATTTEQSLNDIKNYVASISSNTVAEGVSNTEKVQNQSRVKGFNTVYNGVDYGSVFDLNYYMKKYPDLVKAFGNDYDKYLEHFVNHGMKEGRQASETFDVKYYRNKYADLNGHWGNDWEQYYKHFLNHGIQEGRQGSAEFDVQKYKASYTDLQKNLGNVLGRYYKHYNQYGISEGRQGNTFIRDGVDYSPVFDPKYYADRWSDLKKWYGYDSTKLFNHFVDHGMKEGRQASANFNPAKYKEYYKDLQNAFGSDWKKYFIHYLNHGIAEGRKGYKVGAHNISTAQMAWTQEAGGELIYRSTDGAILTPLNVGDKVFTAEMSENLWNLAQLKQRPYIPTNNGGKTINNSNAISITLPNVQNYEQFKTALQNDPKMTQFIQQITLGEATNGIKLNKKKF